MDIIEFLRIIGYKQELQCWQREMLRKLESGEVTWTQRRIQRWK